MTPKHIVVVGGSIAGLGAALLLSQRGHRITILEQDDAELPENPVEAFERWDRRGAPQARHSHAFLARLRNLLRERLPDVYASLLAHGAEELPFTAMASRLHDRPEFVPADEEIVLLACRRITFEWVLRRCALKTGSIHFQSDGQVLGLRTRSEAQASLPVVTGVRLRRDGEIQTLDADLVVDASGRRSRLTAWLQEIGGAELAADSEPCGIFYCTRFYRRRPGAAAPAGEGAIGADLGYLKYGIFQADDGIFSITLAASPDDDPLRRVLRVPAFERAAAALPAVAAWVDPAVSEPVSDVHGMGNLNNTLRHFVRQGEPRALGVFPIGDALVHTNPITGRGCSLAWITAGLLDDALAAHPDDLRAFARALDAGIRREVLPWYEAALAQDRDAIAINRAQRDGVDPFAPQRADGSVDPQGYARSLIRDGFIPGLREDLVLLRAFMRIFNMLERPADLMRDPAMLQRVLAAYARRGERRPAPLGPERDEMIALLWDAA